MASNEVKLTIRVGDDGSLNVIAKKASEAAKATDGLSKATDKASKSRNNYNKAEKGVGQLTNNSTKAFSKQASVIGTGLVPAYATLAANVFAITAAFNALKRADAFRLLEEGLNKVGAAAGRNLPYVADRLKDITGAAISSQQAMESVALGTSSGFNQEQLEGLAKVARGASTALGRDLGDALSRLTRGAAKLEPEILDELGIMVRLDDATTTYAASLGKTADQLSILERRQAFTNAILDQGLEKYGALAESVEPSAYDQLAAAFDSLSKALLQLVNGALTPVINLLSGNQASLIGATVLFGTTISRQMVPALYEGAKAAAQQADALAEQAEEVQANIKTTGNLPKVYRTLSTSIQEGTATQAEYKDALTSLDKSLKLHAGQLSTLEKAHDAESEKLKVKKAKIAEVTAARATLLNTMSLQRAASAKIAAANAIEAASTLNLKLAYKNLKLAVEEYAASQALAALAAGKTIGIFGKLRKGAFAAALSFRVLGTALLSAIPLIGQIILVGSLLWEMLKAIWPETDKVTEATDKAIESLDSFRKAYDDLQQRLKKEGVQPIIEEAVTLTGVYTDLAARVKEITDSIQDPNSEKLQEAIDKANEFRELVSKGDDRGGNYFTRIFQGEGLNTFWRSTQGLAMSLDYLDDKIERLSKKQATSITPVGEQVAEEIKRFTARAITDLAVFGESTQVTRDHLANFLTMDIASMGSASITAFFEALGPEVKALTNAITNSEDAFSKFRTETAKYEKKSLTPFDQIINQAVVLRDTFDTLTNEQAEALAKKLPEAFRKTFGSSKAAVTAFVTELEKNQKVLLETPGAIQQNEAALAKLNKVRSQSAIGLDAALQLENTITDQKISQLEAEQNLIDLVTGTTEEKARSIEIDREIAALREKIVSDEIRSAEVAVVAVQERQKALGIEQRIASSKRAQFESEAKMRRLQQVQINSRDKLTRDPSVSALQERNIFEKEKTAREKLIKEENALKLKAIEMEYDLLEAQANLLRERLKAANLSTESIDNYISSLGEAEQAAVAAQNAAGAAALQELTNQGILNQQNVENAALEAATQGGSTSSRFENFSKEGGFGELDTLNEAVQASRSLLTPMMDDLAKLGPDGELVAAVAQGALTIADSMTKAFESGATGMEKAAGVAQAIGDTIGAVNSMMQASIQATIAKIDDQIDAEKKRDGKSAESVAKIQALEKKKEAQQRKAFETNKKMLMAQTVANTAAGIMRAIAEGGLAGIVIGGIIAAMGAAQLAIISSQTFQGGSSSAPSAPSSISMGARRSSVDLAKSQSARGELAYFRGESGSGGPETFTNAFAGYKNRAEGGNTAYMVGEQGPELFVPEMPGRIVANDDIAPAAPTNVSFNINTIDASGVEDMLVAQRGNIIGMIRQAANSYGQDFVEDVDTSVFTQSAGGVNRY